MLSVSAGSQTTGLIAGGGSLTMTGPGTLVLAATNTYGGGTRLTGGLLSFGNGGLGSAGAISPSAGTLQWAAGNTQDLSSRMTIPSGGTATLDTQGNGVTFNTGVGGGGALVKLGTGTLTLANYNSYSGGTVVNAGTLSLNKPANNGTGAIVGSLTINAGGNVSASTDNWDLGYTNSSVAVTAITINGGQLTFRGANSNGGTVAPNINMTGGTIGGSQFDWYRNITATPTLTTSASSVSSVISSGINLRLLVANSLTFNVAQGTVPSGVDLLVSGPIGQTEGGGIIKSGAGLMELTAANSYNGGTTIFAGTLQIGNAASLGTGSVTLVAGELRLRWHDVLLAVQSARFERQRRLGRRYEQRRLNVHCRQRDFGRQRATRGQQPRHHKQRPDRQRLQPYQGRHGRADAGRRQQLHWRHNPLRRRAGDQKRQRPGQRRADDQRRLVGLHVRPQPPHLDDDGQ